MRHAILPALAAGTLFSLPVFAADEAELAAIRAQIAEMKQAYEQRIAALEGRLAAAEKPQAAPVASTSLSPAAPVTSVVPAPRGLPAANAFNPEVSLILQGQYRDMKNIAERGSTGFWPAAGHNHAGSGVTPENRRGFTLDHTEVVLSANIDPNWRGQAILALLDGEVEVEEAWFQSLGLGNGLGLKGGRFRSGIGYLNEQHPHMWDFAGAPLMYAAMFGGDGSYVQDGVQFKWLAPTPLWVEFGAEAGRGASFPGSERNRNGSGAGAVFVHLGDDLGVAHSWRAGLSYLATRAQAREGEGVSLGLGDHAPVTFSGRSQTLIADFVWKWAPDGNPKYRNFKVQGEYFQRRERGDLGCYLAAGICDAESAAGAALTGLDTYRRAQSGGYLQAVYQFAPQWRAGVRYEQLHSGLPTLGAAATAQIDADSPLLRNFRPQRSSAMIDYSWSEFSRVRLQYAQDKSMQGLTDHQWTLQYIMSLGAHGAHKF